MLQYEEARRAKSCMQQERNAAVWPVDLSAGTLKLGYYCEHNLPASYFCSNTLSTRRRRSLLAAPRYDGLAWPGQFNLGNGKAPRSR